MEVVSSDKGQLAVLGSIGILFYSGTNVLGCRIASVLRVDGSVFFSQARRKKFHRLRRQAGGEVKVSCPFEASQSTRFRGAFLRFGVSGPVRQFKPAGGYLLQIPLGEAFERLLSVRP